MPRKTILRHSEASKQSKPASRKNLRDDEWGGFVQCNIGEAEREAYDLWASENARVNDQLIVDALGTGLKLTAVWDGSNQCFIVTYTGRPDIEAAQPFTTSLSARGGTLAEALLVLNYKHFEVTGQDWTEWLINGSKTKRNFG